MPPNTIFTYEIVPTNIAQHECSLCFFGGGFLYTNKNVVISSQTVVFASKLHKLPLDEEHSFSVGRIDLNKNNLVLF